MQGLNLGHQQPHPHVSNQLNSMNMKPPFHSAGNNVPADNRPPSQQQYPPTCPPLHIPKPQYNSNMHPGFMTPPVMQSSSVMPQSPLMVHAASMPNLQHQLSSGDSPPVIQSNAHGQRMNQPHIARINSQPTSNYSLWNQPATGNDNPSTMLNTPASTKGSVPTCDGSHVGQPLFYFSAQASHPAVANAVSTATSNVRSSAEISCFAKPQYVQGLPDATKVAQLNNTMPALSTDEIEHSHHVRSSSLPDFQQLENTTPMEQNMIPPPTDGYYTKRASSACSSRQRTPSPVPSEHRIPETGVIQNERCSSDTLSNTLEKLNFAIEKCSPMSEKKLIDEVRKRLDIFSKSWTEGSLSEQVKFNMVALSTGETISSLYL